MHTLDLDNCLKYLREKSLVDRDEAIAIELLTGGVSNVVFRVQREAGDEFVLKQARGQLRVAQPWFCSVERIWREAEVLRICSARLEDQTGIGAARVLFEDRENYVFTMQAAPREHTTWKHRLMSGEVNHETASACGRMLGRLHAATWGDSELAEKLGDRQFFFDLRVDPYYRRVAEVHSDLREELAELIASLDANRHCLVHGDFSPKNLLVWDDPSPHLMLIDCEVGHYGDPAFDLGFMLSHLALKAVYFQRQQPDVVARALSLVASFWSAYGDEIRHVISPNDLDVLQKRAVRNLAGCLLARIDGKSPVEYLVGEEQQDLVRQLARALFAQQAGNVQSATEEIGGALAG